MIAGHTDGVVLSMDGLYLGESQIARNAWVLLDAEGVILEIGQGAPARVPANHLKGLVFGGMVNAHCHLELSHLRGRIPENTGMAGFVLKLQEVRSGLTEQEASAAAVVAVEEMRRNGILGVGDICNGTQSLAAKALHPDMHFHSFVEVFGLDPSRAEETFMRALDIANQLGTQASVTLHAPYSISMALRDRVQQYAGIRNWPQSLHLLESKEERQLFESLDGPLMEMIRLFKAPFPGHVSHSPIAYLLPTQPPTCSTLLVHLVEIRQDEADWVAMHFGGNGFAVLCPRANLFIHGSLPPVETIRRAGLPICLGTDSLAGNWSLDLWAEMRTLQQAFGFDVGEMLTWAVDNGCRALGFPKEDFIPTQGMRFDVWQLENFDFSTGLIPEKPIIKSFSA